MALLLTGCRARDAVESVGPIRAIPGALGTRLTAAGSDSLRLFIDGDSARVLRFSPIAPDDPERARLCGYLVAEPTAALRVPLPAGMDSTAPRVLLDYLRGARSRGLRYVIPGMRSEYVYVGLTDDGRYRIDFRQPVQLGPLPMTSEPPTAEQMAATVQPSIDALDAFAHSARLRDAGPVPELAGVLPDSAREPELAVPDIRDIPDAPLTLDGACPAATLGTLGLARIERNFRVRVPAGHTLHARARASIGGIVLSVDLPAVPDSARRNVAPVRRDSVVATIDREVILRVLYAPVLRKEPDRAFVTLSVALARTAPVR